MEEFTNKKKRNIYQWHGKHCYETKRKTVICHEQWFNSSEVSFQVNPRR